MLFGAVSRLDIHIVGLLSSGRESVSDEGINFSVSFCEKVYPFLVQIWFESMSEICLSYKYNLNIWSNRDFIEILPYLDVKKYFRLE